MRALSALGSPGCSRLRYPSDRRDLLQRECGTFAGRDLGQVQLHTPSTPIHPFAAPERLWRHWDEHRAPLALPGLLTPIVQLRSLQREVVRTWSALSQSLRMPPATYILTGKEYPR